MGVQKSGSTHTKVEVSGNEVQDTLFQNMAPWPIEGFKLNMFQKTAFSCGTGHKTFR